MTDILHDFPVARPPEHVFAAVSTPAGLDTWWTLRSSGHAQLDQTFELGFGPAYEWRARVSRCVPSGEFELEMTQADRDWLGTRVGFTLTPQGTGTHVRFHHTGWPSTNDHYRTSCYCWAMYLRLLRRYVEEGEVVPYDRRLDV